MYAKEENVQRQVASLTKIMTAVVVQDLLKKYKLNPYEIKIDIIPINTTPALGGTSAELLPNDVLTVHELMHGMMLPSGNDAAQSLATYFGNFVHQVTKQN